MPLFTSRRGFLNRIHMWNCVLMNKIHQEELKSSPSRYYRSGMNISLCMYSALESFVFLCIYKQYSNVHYEQIRIHSGCFMCLRFLWQPVTAYLSPSMEQSEHWRRLWDWSFCPCVCPSLCLFVCLCTRWLIIISTCHTQPAGTVAPSCENFCIGRDMHSHKHLLDLLCCC